MVWRYWYSDVLPFTAMAAVECANVGLNTLFKAATLKGLSFFVFLFYSYAMCAFVLLPLAFIFRRTGLPPFKLSLLYRIILLGFIGVGSDICAYKGIEFSSPTLSSAFSNLTPAFTFMLAVIFRMERVALRSSSTQAKIIGTLLSISGALIAVLYKGPTLLSSTPSNKLQHSWGTSQTNWLIGGFLFFFHYLMVSTWYIVQTKVMKIYPAELIVVFLFFVCATIIAAPICFIAETNSSAWRLRPDITLVTIILRGFGPSFSCVVHTWGLHLKGPVYVSIFKPFAVVIAACMGVVFLGDDLHLGCVLGAIILSLGFYGLTWGKAKEEEIMSEGCGHNMSKTPLLQSHKV